MSELDAEDCLYSHFTISSPSGTLHTAITHIITVLEQRSLTWNSDDI